MKIRADISITEDGEDKVLSVCQCGAAGDIEADVIIQRGPKEYEAFDDQPGPRISCAAAGLDLEPGPELINFEGNTMRIMVAGAEPIEVDIGGLPEDEQLELKRMAGVLVE